MTDAPRPRFGCVVLAGGKGTRLGGVDKARLTFEGRTYLERIAAELDGFGERLVSGGAADLAASAGFRFVPDTVPDQGPMGGLRDALAACASDVLLVVPCDLPLFRKELAEALVRAWEPLDDALVLRDEEDRLQPLCGLYAKRCAGILSRRLAQGERRMSGLAEVLRMRSLPLPPALRGSSVLRNVNRPEDLP